MEEERLIQLVEAGKWQTIKRIWKSENMFNAEVYATALVELEQQTSRIERLVKIAAKAFNSFESRQDAIELTEKLDKLVYLIRSTTYSLLKTKEDKY